MLIRQHIPQSCFSLSKKFSRFRNWNHTLSIKINQQQNVYVTCTCSSRSIKHRVPCILKPTLRGISCLEWACCCIATEFPSIIDEFAQICMFGWWWSINTFIADKVTDNCKNYIADFVWNTCCTVEQILKIWVLMKKFRLWYLLLLLSIWHCCWEANKRFSELSNWFDIVVLPTPVLCIQRICSLGNHVTRPFVSYTHIQAYYSDTN